MGSVPTVSREAMMRIAEYQALHLSVFFSIFPSVSNGQSEDGGHNLIRVDPRYSAAVFSLV